MKQAVCVFVTSLSLAACATTPPEVRLVNDAADALGGKDRVLAVKSIVLEGEGEAPNLGQNITPEAELPVWKATDYRRTIDPANGRMRVTQTRTAQFLFANSPVQKQDQGLDGDVA